MFSKAKSKPNAGVAAPQQLTEKTTPLSVLSPNLRVIGNLESEGDLQIDGTVDGDIRTVKLTVGKSAVINGSIYGEKIRIAGTVNGEITAKTVVLLDTAKVTGDINHDSLSIEAGAYVQGLCKRVDVEVLKPKGAKPVDASSADKGKVS